MRSLHFSHLFIRSYGKVAQMKTRCNPMAATLLSLSSVFIPRKYISQKRKIREAYALREVGPVWSPWHGKNTFWLSFNKWYVTMINTLSCRCWQENISSQNTAEQTQGLVTGRSLLLTSPSHVLFVQAWCVSLPARKAQGRFTQERNKQQRSAESKTLKHFFFKKKALLHLPYTLLLVCFWVCIHIWLFGWMYWTSLARKRT